MGHSTVEIDFFQIEKRRGSSSARPPSESVRSSCRRIQNVVSKINPVLLKTVMAAGAVPQERPAGGIGLWTNGSALQSSNLPSPSAMPDTNPTLLSPLPLLHPAAASRSGVHGHPDTAPLTIFYNGKVTAFDVTSDMADAIIRMAESEIVEKPVEMPAEPLLDGQHVDGDLMPIARKKSLQRFLEKRKERA